MAETTDLSATPDAPENPQVAGTPQAPSAPKVPDVVKAPRADKNTTLGGLIKTGVRSIAMALIPGRKLSHGVPGGAIPPGTTIFDDGVPGVANLEPAFLAALRRAAFDAAADGVEFGVNSGWRAPQYQNRLLREAVTQLGSAEEAARWVATPERSAHVAGDAVDLGRPARPWLRERGAAYGLCQIYGNESWHYELRPDAVENGCPPLYPDPTHDPRLKG